MQSYPSASRLFKHPLYFAKVGTFSLSQKHACFHRASAIAAALRVVQDQQHLSQLAQLRLLPAGYMKTPVHG